MAFLIRSAEADRLVRESQGVTGESLTEAVTVALAQRLEREKRRAAAGADVMAVVEETWERLRDQPVMDPRSDEEILGYGDDGLPH